MDDPRHRRAGSRESWRRGRRAADAALPARRLHPNRGRDDRSGGPAAGRSRLVRGRLRDRGSAARDVWRPLAVLERSDALEPEQRGDPLKRPEIGVMADDHNLGILRQRRLDRGLPNVLDLDQLAAVGRTPAIAVEQQQAAGSAAPAVSVESRLEQQRLDPSLVERLERALGAADRAPAAADPGGEAVQRVALTLLVVLFHQLLDRPSDLLVGRAREVHVEVTATAQLGRRMASPARLANRSAAFSKYGLNSAAK